MDSNINCSTVSFFTLNPFNIDDVFLSVYLNNFANLLTSIMASYNLKDNHLNNITITKLVKYVQFVKLKVNH